MTKSLKRVSAPVPVEMETDRVITEIICRMVIKGKK
jgi:hypothetical protein